MNRCKNGPRRGCKVIKIIGMTLAGLALAVLFALVFGLAVQYLWNWLLPDLFGFKTITFLQAFVLIILSKILFSGIGHRGRAHGRTWGHRHCKDNSHGWHADFSHDEWNQFHQFWEDEGKTAFQKYIEKVNNAGNVGQPDAGKKDSCC